MTNDEDLEEAKSAIIESRSLIRYWVADKDDYDDGELFKTKNEAIKHAESDNKWVKVYKGDFSKLAADGWKDTLEIIWTRNSL